MVAKQMYTYILLRSLLLLLFELFLISLLLTVTFIVIVTDVVIDIDVLIVVKQQCSHLLQLQSLQRRLPSMQPKHEQAEPNITSGRSQSTLQGSTKWLCATHVGTSTLGCEGVTPVLGFLLYSSTSRFVLLSCPIISSSMIQHLSPKMLKTQSRCILSCIATCIVMIKHIQHP